MARVAGVEVPIQKPAWVALTYVYGIGRKSSRDILGAAGVDPITRAKDLTGEQLSRINEIIERNYVVEGALRRQQSQAIARLKEIRCYRGLRHVKGLPVRGQRTRSNARTRKGPRKTVAGKKIAKRMA